MNSYDVLILGGGAAGLMCAAEAAARGKKVLVLEQSQKPAPKILVSGGGRCNFTNMYAKPANYISSNPAFVHYAMGKFTPKHFIDLVKKAGIKYHEKKDGQLFCDTSAKEIIDMLVDRAEEKGAKMLLGQKVDDFNFTDGLFTIGANGKSYTAPKLVVATGGLSWPQLGATDLGFRIAKRFELTVLPQSPALCGLTFAPPEMERFKDLSGVHGRAWASTGKWKMEEDFLITHKGLSGPLMLNCSLYWNPGQEITINWIPEMSVEETFAQLKKDKISGGRGEYRKWFEGRLPRRLAERIAWHAGARGAWAALPDDVLLTLAKDINAYTFIPAGTFGYRMAEVTRGGVDTREITRETMEAKKVPGLYFIGEVLDVTGMLGGFNFQWAWASGWTAGQAV
jgi:predicted Rossmann fold flavoprotein